MRSGGDRALRLGWGDEPAVHDPLAVAAEEVVGLLHVERVQVQDAVPDERRVLRRHLLEPRDDGADRARRQAADGLAGNPLLKARSCCSEASSQAPLSQE